VVAQSFQPAKPAVGFSKPVTLAAGVPKGNTSGLVAFKGHVGVMWSNGKAEEFGFRAHQDGKPADQWEPAEVAAGGKGVVNDHLNLAADADGNVWAVTKAATGIGVSAVQLTLHRRNAEGKWDKHYPVLTGELVEGKNLARTRPVVVLDADKPVAYVLCSDKANVSSIYLRRVSLTDGKASEEIKILSAGYALNNVTDCKAMVSAKTGLLVLAGAADAKTGPACFLLFEKSIP
jgi:hypothetical protein